MQAYFEQVTKFLGAASGVLLIYSVFYDFNYFLALGLSFDDVPTTIGDHVRTGVIWLPTLILFVGGLYFVHFICNLEYVTERVMAPPPPLVNAEEIPPEGGRAKNSVKEWVIYIAVLVACFTVLAAVRAIISAGGSIIYLYYLFTPVWGALVSWIAARPAVLRALTVRGYTVFPKTAFQLFVWIPVSFVLVGLAGYSSGRNQYSNAYGRTVWTVEFKPAVGNAVQTCDLAGFRRFSNVAVLVGRDQTVTVVPSDRVLSIRQASYKHLENEGQMREPACPIIQSAPAS